MNERSEKQKVEKIECRSQKAGSKVNEKQLMWEGRSKASQEQKTENKVNEKQESREEK